ncbi:MULTISPECIES: hypothetical protein [unclassified Rickettsia]
MHGYRNRHYERLDTLATGYLVAWLEFSMSFPRRRESRKYLK